MVDGDARRPRARMDLRVCDVMKAQMMNCGFLLGACCLLTACDTDFDAFLATAGGEPRQTSEWSAYGGPGGRKFSALEEITRDNVG